jgi:hypothetical protein
MIVKRWQALLTTNTLNGAMASKAPSIRRRRPSRLNPYQIKYPRHCWDILFGGATGTQTLDLFHAMEAL